MNLVRSVASPVARGARINQRGSMFLQNCWFSLDKQLILLHLITSTPHIVRENPELPQK